MSLGDDVKGFSLIVLSITGAVTMRAWRAFGPLAPPFPCATLFADEAETHYGLLFLLDEIPVSVVARPQERRRPIPLPPAQMRSAPLAWLRIAALAGRAANAWRWRTIRDFFERRSRFNVPIACLSVFGWDAAIAA